MHTYLSFSSLWSATKLGTRRYTYSAAGDQCVQVPQPEEGVQCGSDEVNNLNSGKGSMFLLIIKRNVLYYCMISDCPVILWDCYPWTGEGLSRASNYLTWISHTEARNLDGEDEKEGNGITRVWCFFLVFGTSGPKSNFSWLLLRFSDLADFHPLPSTSDFQVFVGK